MSDVCVERRRRDVGTRGKAERLVCNVPGQWGWRGDMGAQIIKQVKSSGPST